MRRESTIAVSLKLQSHRNNNFDFLRFALAVLVILSHSFDLLNRKSENPFVLMTRGQSEGGSLAVDAFFVISGYLIAQSFLNSRGIGSYMLKRVLRIYPGFIVAGVLSLLVIGPIGMAYSQKYWDSIEPGTFAWRLVTLQTLWIPQSFKSNHWPYVNTAVWTIQYEFLCYLLIALIGVIGVLRKKWVVLGLFLAAYGWHMLHLYKNMWVYEWKELPVGGSPDYYPRFVTYFLAGCVCLAFRQELSYTWKMAIPALAVTIASAAWGHGMDAVLPWTMPLMIFTLAFTPTIRLGNWGKYGDFSYGLYIFAWPVQQTIIHLSGGKIGPLALFGLAFMITLVIAVGSWYAVERPFLRMKPKAKPAEKPVAVPVGVG